MREKSMSALLLVLLSLQGISAYNISYGELANSMQTSSADIWSDRGGEGPNVTCGYVKLGENVTLFFEVSSPMYVRMIIVRPDGSEVEMMKNSQVFPGITYRFHQMFVEPGMRIIKLLGGASGRVLDYCTLHVVTSLAGGDVWTDAGGRGYGIDGGSFTAGTPFGVWLRLNVTSEARLILQDPRGKESVLFSGTLEGERSRRIILELSELGNYTLRLMQGNRILDYCVISLVKPVERFPPSIRISSISLNDSRVRVEGEAIPGSPGKELKIIWDWGDGSVEEGPFPRSHEYAGSGHFTIRIIVKQSDGLSANFTYALFVPPKVVRVPIPQLENMSAVSESETRQTETKVEERHGGFELLAFALGVLTSALAFLITSRLMRGSKP